VLKKLLGGLQDSFAQSLFFGELNFHSTCSDKRYKYTERSTKKIKWSKIVWLFVAYHAFAQKK